jgi:hypothetical protein
MFPIDQEIYLAPVFLHHMQEMTTLIVGVQLMNVIKSVSIERLLQLSTLEMYTAVLEKKKYV